MQDLAGSSVLRDGFPCTCSRLFSYPLTLPGVVTTFRVCLPRVPALRQVLGTMLAEGALDSPLILVLAFHLSLSLVEGSSDGLVAGGRFLSPGRLCLTHSVRVELSRLCAVSLCGLAFLTPLGLTVDYCRIQWRRSSRKLLRFPCGLGLPVLSLDWVLLTFFPVFPRVFSPGVVMAPSHGFRLRRSGRLAASGSSELGAALSFHSVLSLRHILPFCAMRVGVPPLFLRSLRRSMASCLAALPFASLPLVSRLWMVLSWSHLMCLSSVSDRFVVVPRQLVGLGGCSPASPNCPPSRVRKQRSFGFSTSLSLRVFAMRSPFRVESVSVLDRNDGSYYTFLVFGRSLLDEVTLTGQVFLRSRSERRLFEHLPSGLVPSLRDGVTRLGSCYVCLHTRSERRLLPSIYPSLLRDGVTL